MPYKVVPQVGNSGVSTALISSPRADEPSSTSLNTKLSERLWDLAYDSLKADEPKSVEAYEKILSYEITQTRSSPSGIKDQAALDDQDNIIEQDNPAMRKLQMLQTVQIGMKKIEKEAKAKKGLGDFVTFVLARKEVIDAALQAVPQAALAWSGCCFVLQILLNPVQQTAMNQEGLLYVLTRMNWYLAVSDLVLKKTQGEEIGSLRTEIQNRILDLYKSLLLYQMKSVCSYYRRLLSFLRDLVKLDGWEGAMKAIKDSEAVFLRDSSTYSAQLLTTANEDMAKTLHNIHDALSQRDILADKMRADEKNAKCLQDLSLDGPIATDPELDMTRIEAGKDKLLEDSYVWILKRKEFIDWKDGRRQLLWIKGGPGKGKIMLAIGLIKSLKKQKWDNDAFLFFFCEANSKYKKTGTSVLRGLLYQLVKQQISLISYIHDAGRSVFDSEDPDAYFALLGIFEEMLKDPDLMRIHLVVDALDECQVGLPHLLKFIGDMCWSNERVKWLVTSRPRFDIEEALGCFVEVNLESNACDDVSDSVNSFIAHKVQELRRFKGYNSHLEFQAKDYLEKHADGTFLWVALACKQLESPDTMKHNTIPLLKSFQSNTLDEIYKRMLENMLSLLTANLKICRQILAVATIAQEPLNIYELVSIAGLEGDLGDEWDNRKMVEDLVERCGSFLTIRDLSIYFVHQPAREYCQSKADSEVFPQGKAKVHSGIAECSLETMSRLLRQDIYSFHDPDSSVRQSPFAGKDPGDPLLRCRYACIQWVDHLSALDEQQREQVGLHDNGRVHKFLQRHVLHWLEALCWMRYFPRGIVMIETLCSLSTVCYFMYMLRVPI